MRYAPTIKIFYPDLPEPLMKELEISLRVAEEVTKALDGPKPELSLEGSLFRALKN